jgi:hypothetical protein
MHSLHARGMICMHLPLLKRQKARTRRDLEGVGLHGKTVDSCEELYILKDYIDCKNRLMSLWQEEGMAEDRALARMAGQGPPQKSVDSCEELYILKDYIDCKNRLMSLWQ